MTNCTYREQNGCQGKTLLCGVYEDLWGLATESESVQNTGRAEKEAVPSREGAREHTGIDDMRKNLKEIRYLAKGNFVLQTFHSCADQRNHVGRLGCITSAVEQCGIIIRNKHADHYDAENLEIVQNDTFYPAIRLT